MKPSRLLVPLAGVLAAAVVLTSCSSSVTGSGSTASGGPGSSASSPSTPATSTADSSATTSPSSGSSGSAPTKAQLQRIVLQASDLPSTYEATAAEPDSGDNSMDAQLAACTGVKGAPDSDKIDTAQSPDFTMGEITISSEFSSYPSQSDVDADAAQLKSPKINECLNTALKTTLAESAGAGATISSASIKVTPGSGGGPSNVAGLATGTVSLTVSGQQAAVYLGVAFITGPQLDGTLMFLGIGKPLDTATQASVLNAVAARAANP